jgi:phosphatidylserine/phosphatidylglycerophosphate/cardiolipin synthase-like enzyme
MNNRLKTLSSQGIGKVGKVFRAAMNSSPSEMKWTFGGGAAGLGAGWAVGGAIGVVGFFGGIGIPMVALGLIGGAIFGNRVGIARDKNERDKLLRESNEILARLLQEQNQKKIKPITSNEDHRAVLMEALDKASDTLVILSGWATSYVINRDFQDRLAKCLKRGVNVYIGYGYQAAHEPRPKKTYEKEAENNLKALSEWCATQETDGFLIVRYYPNHTKLLICDEKFAVNGSFNWLSNSGRSLNEERSWVVYDKKFISTELDIVIHDLMSPLKSTKRDLLKMVVPWSAR